MLLKKIVILTLFLSFHIPSGLSNISFPACKYIHIAFTAPSPPIHPLFTRPLGPFSEAIKQPFTHPKSRNENSKQTFRLYHLYQHVYPCSTPYSPYNIYFFLVITVNEMLTISSSILLLYVQLPRAALEVQLSVGLLVGPLIARPL